MKTLPNILNNTQLKLIALISMLTDHICTIVFPDSFPAQLLSLTVGRIAMPLYCFLLSEGFFHTRSKTRYCIRLLIFALISEPVFDLAKYKVPFNLQEQNVFFSLLLSLLMLCLLEHFSSSIINISQVFITAVFMLVAWSLHLDYDFCAVAMAAVFYFMRWQKRFFSSAAACSITAFSYLTFGTYLAVIPISLYNGKHSSSSSIIKYLFYIIYPLHLFIIYLLL